MGIVKGILANLFDLLFLPFRGLGPLWALVVFSLLAGILMLWIFGKVSNQDAIRVIRDRIRANMMAIRLYGDDIGLLFCLMGRILRETVVYLKVALLPLLVMLIPVLAILVQLNLSFQARPLQRGEQVLVKVTVRDPATIAGGVSPEVAEQGAGGFDRAAWSTEGRVRVPLSTSRPVSTAAFPFPVSGGIPLPRGELRSTVGAAVVTGDGKARPAQFRPLGYWNDRSIKWLQVDTQLPPGRAHSKVFLQYGATTPAENPVLEVSDSSSGITVNTGTLKFEIRRGGFRLFDRLWLDRDRDGSFSDEEQIVSGGDLLLVHDGREYRSSADPHYRLTVEERGPLKVTLKAEGWFYAERERRFCRFIVRLQAFAGLPWVRVYHTFVYTGYPANEQHYLYRDKRLPANETVDAILLETHVRVPGPLVCTLGSDAAETVALPGDRDLEIVQAAADAFTVESVDGTLAEGKRLTGWLDLASPGGGVMVAVRNLWQQFPKGWSLHPEDGMLVTSLWPARAGALDLSTPPEAKGDGAAARGSAFGLAKTHELAFFFHGTPLSASRSSELAGLLVGAPLLRADSAWVAATGAVGKLRPREKGRLRAAERLVDGIFDWAARQIRDSGWYGMLDFGDTRSRYVDQDESRGWLRDGRWGWMNNEAMGLHSGSFLQYLRTGDFKYFELGENVALHVMDVDTVHYNTVAGDGRLSDVIPDDYSRVGSQHRHNVAHWGGRNEEVSHTNLNGILLYYYMTGYERAFDVAKEIAGFLLEERVTYFRHPDNCPQRSIANLVWGAIQMYEATGEARYKQVADKWAAILREGQRPDGSWQEKYDPQSGTWKGKPKTLFTLQYTLPALVAYHRATGDEAIADSIVKATRYYMQKRPYNPYFEALSYSHDLTGDPAFLKAAREHLEYFLRRQQTGGRPLQKGMIFSKLYYLRPIEFLYQIPFVFELLPRKGA